MELLESHNFRPDDITPSEIKISLAATELELRVPTADLAENLVTRKAGTEKTRAAWRLSNKGKEVAQSIWQDLVKNEKGFFSLNEMPIVLRTLRDYRQQSSSLNEYQRNFIRLMEQSLNFKFQRLKKIVAYEELKSSNSDWETLVDKIWQHYYPGKSRKFVHNFAWHWALDFKIKINQRVRQSFLAWQESPSNGKPAASLEYCQQSIEKSALSELIDEMEKSPADSQKVPDISKALLDRYDQDRIGQSLNNIFQARAEREKIWESITPQAIPSGDRAYKAIDELTGDKEPINGVGSIPGDRRLTGKGQNNIFSNLTQRISRFFQRNNRRLLLSLGLASSLFISGVKKEIGVSSSLSRVSASEMSFLDRKTIIKGLVAELAEKIPEPLKFLPNEIIADEVFVHRDSLLSTTDIIRHIRYLSDEIFNSSANPDAELVQRYVNTVKLLLSAKQLYPQACSFQIADTDGKLTIAPLNWQEKIKIEKRHSTNILVMGGELESVTAAMRAAKLQLDVVLVYSGSLGGLSADTGGNMRYFDAVQNVKTVPEHFELFREGLGMSNDNLWSIPPDTHNLILSFLQKKYPNIRLVETGNIDAVHVDMNGDSIAGILTGEGIYINCQQVIDSDPEAALAEKIGLPVSVETPNLAYGLVFDVQGLDNRDFRNFVNKNQLSGDRILKMFNLSYSDIKQDQETVDLYHSVNRLIHSRTNDSNSYVHWGYQSLAHAFKFYMKIQEFVAPLEIRDRITSLNQRRMVDGFNVALHQDGSATFNSLSYHFDKAVRQGRHNLFSDPEFKDIREIEISHLERFLQSLTGKNDIKIKMPQQLYCRQANYAVRTLNPYELKNMANNNVNPDQPSMAYPLDSRGLMPRFPGDQTANLAWQNIETLKDAGFNSAHWQIDSETTATQTRNYYVMGKNGTDQATMPAARILQHQMGLGTEAISMIVANKINESEEPAVYSPSNNYRFFNSHGLIDFSFGGHAAQDVRQTGPKKGCDTITLKI